MSPVAGVKPYIPRNLIQVETGLGGASGVGVVVVVVAIIEYFLLKR